MRFTNNLMNGSTRSPGFTKTKSMLKSNSLYGKSKTKSNLITYMFFFSSNCVINGSGDHVCVCLKIGPIPLDDGVGKEIITQLTANMVTNKEFYTDSNGRDFLKRVISETFLLFEVI